jgi:hypothetical protein
MRLLRKDALQVKDTLQVRNETDFKCTTRLTSLTFYSTGLKSIMQHIRKRSDCAYSPSPRLCSALHVPDTSSHQQGISTHRFVTHTTALSLSLFLCRYNMIYRELCDGRVIAFF